jgi:hypothetical protein
MTGQHRKACGGQIINWQCIVGSRLVISGPYHLRWGDVGSLPSHCRGEAPQRFLKARLRDEAVLKVETFYSA